ALRWACLVDSSLRAPLFCSHRAGAPIPLRSFPTRRSSDLFLNESADAPVEVFGAIGQNLLGERAHAAAVFPEPTAPTMAVPVKRPRSGMTSQRGASEGLCLRG